MTLPVFERHLGALDGYQIEPTNLTMKKLNGGVPIDGKPLRLLPAATWTTKRKTDAAALEIYANVGSLMPELPKEMRADLHAKSVGVLRFDELPGTG